MNAQTSNQLVQPRPGLSTFGLLMIIGGVITVCCMIAVFAGVWVLDRSTKTPRQTAADNSMPKVNAKVFTAAGTLYIENTNTNQWNRGELILDPAGDRYRVRMEGIPPARLAEFDLAEFATTGGNRFPASAKVPRMVEVRVDGMASSVYLLQ